MLSFYLGVPGGIFQCFASFCPPVSSHNTPNSQLVPLSWSVAWPCRAESRVGSEFTPPLCARCHDPASPCLQVLPAAAAVSPSRSGVFQNSWQRFGNPTSVLARGGKEGSGWDRHTVVWDGPAPASDGSNSVTFTWGLERAQVLTWALHSSINHTAGQELSPPHPHLNWPSSAPRTPHSAEPVVC